jgi:hypothetical protein
MSKLRQFFRDSGALGMATEIMAVVSFVIGVIEHIRDKPVATVVLVGASIPLFGYGAYRAWDKQNERAELLLRERGLPKPFMSYKSERHMDFGAAVFFVQVEGEKVAFDVELTSQPAVATDHSRIFMEWSVPKGPVRQTPVPVKAMCRKYKGDMAHVASTHVVPDQIHTFFERKKDAPELVVTMSYKDVDGRKCPPKDFRITSKRDSRGNFEIGISPLERLHAGVT